MIIMGIDPGTARVGWATIELAQGKPTAKAYGCITTAQTDAQPKRLLAIHTAIIKLIDKFHPDIMSVEELFFATNAKTAISVGQSRGVILLTAEKRRTPVVSYAPLAIKRTICGDGKADKGQVQRMVTRLLRLKQIPKPDDAADALAIALTHAYSYKMKSKFT